MATANLALTYSQSKQPIVGVPFFLVHRRGRINLIRLKEKLQGRFTEEEIPIPEETTGKTEEEIYIPDIFKEQEKILLKSSIDETVLTLSSLFGKATVDRPVQLDYRDKKILVIGTTQIYFAILYDNKTKRHYLVVFGSRANSREMHTTLNSFLGDLGIVSVPSKLEPERIDEVRRELNGNLLDTTLGNFPSQTITKKRIWGRGYQNEPAYLRDAEIGSIRQHMFEFKAGNLPYSVVTLSEDGLTRFYTSLTYKDFEWFLRERIFQRLRQIKKPEVPMVAYTTLDDLFESETSES